MALPATYDFTKESLIVGAFIITGFADVDDAITPSRRNDMWDLISGADGDAVFIKKTDRSGIITIKLLASSSSNDTLSTIAASQGSHSDLVIIAAVPVLYSDKNGFPLAAASQAMVMRVPDFARGKSLGSVDWVLLCADLTINPRGIN